MCICLKDYLDGAARKQHMTSLEDALDGYVEATIHNEEVELGISSPNEDDEDHDEWLGGMMAMPKLRYRVLF